MLAGPIFRVEMVTVARRRRYFLLRVAYGALALFILWTTYSASNQSFFYGSEATTSIQASQRLATNFFNAFTWLQMFAILIVGPAMAAGTIASERESRTIEYLFATDLSNSEIILGKTIARLCLLGQFVLVCLPILFIFRMLGGIGTELLLSTFLLAGSTAVLVTALGVCVSVWSSKSREATTRVYAILFAALVLPSYLGGMAAYLGGQFWAEYGAPILGYFQLLNPLSLLTVGTWGGQLDLATIAPTLFAQLLVAAMLLLMAIGAVRRVHLSEPTRTAKSVAKLKSPQANKKRRLVGDRAMIWKEVFSGSSRMRVGFFGRLAVGLILGFLLVGSVVSFFYAMTDPTSSGAEEYHGTLVGYTMMLGLGMLLLLAVNASGLITNEKERDCWLSLLATPLTGQEILQGKTLGNLYSVRWLLFVLAFAWMLGVLLDPILILPAIAVLFTLLLLAWYATNLGLYFSLRSQTSMRSMGATLATLFFFGGGYLMCCCPIMQRSGGDEGMLLLLAPCIPTLLFYGVAVFTETGMFGGGAESTLPVAYALGLLLYSFAGAWLYWAATGEFDSLSGRCGKIPEGQTQ